MFYYHTAMNESTKDSSGDDPWGFAASPLRPRSTSLSDVDPIGATDEASVADSAGQRLEHVEGSNQGRHLKERAFSLTIALSVVFALGFIAEIVAVSRFINLTGLEGLVIIYPLGGLGLLAVAFAQVTWIDRIKREKAFVRVASAYGLLFVVAIVLIANSSERLSVIGTGLAVVLADQVNFLLPLIIWAMLGDRFNAAESRKVYPWVISWRYAGQLIGLIIASVAPLLLTRINIPLYTLLYVCPIGLLGLAIFLPRSLKGRSLNEPLGANETVQESIRSAWGFVRDVKAFRAIFITSALVFTAGMALEGTFLTQVAEWSGGSESKVQILYGSTLLFVFIICWLLQRAAVPKLMERLNIPGSLAVLPVATLLGTVVIMAGVQFGQFAAVLIGTLAWRVPWWSIDDVARRAAMALVPDQRRARVSFIVDLVPFAIGLILSGLVLSITSASGVPIWAPIIALPFALAAIPTSRVAIKTWADALLSPQLKRRKRLSEN